MVQNIRRHRCNEKIVASALNAEYTDKIEYFSNALLNSQNESFNQSERLKFIEILRQVSKPALEILALEDMLQKKRGPFYSSQVIKSDLIKVSNLTPHLVEACINELYSLGVFSSTESYSSDGREISGFSNGTAAYTEFTKSLLSLLKTLHSYKTAASDGAWHLT